MTQSTARRVVLVSLGIMFAVTAVRRDKSGSTFRRLWATGALAMLLSTAADFAPGVAGPLALLIGTTYIMGAEDAIAEWLHAGLGGAGATDSTGTGGNLTAPRQPNPRAGGHPGERPT